MQNPLVSVIWNIRNSISEHQNDIDFLYLRLISSFHTVKNTELFIQREKEDILHQYRIQYPEKNVTPVNSAQLNWQSASPNISKK
jgi:hypothetical protein